MNVTEVSNLFKRLVDESTVNFIDDDDRRNALSRAYETFRRAVTDCDSWFYSTSVDITLASASTYSLASGAVSILGSAPTDTRLTKMLLIEALDDSSVSKGILRPADNLEDIIVPWSTSPMPVIGTYALRGSMLYFSNLMTGKFRVHYVPVSTVDWSLDGSGDNEWIDDVPDDLQALIAYIAYTDLYAPLDGYENGLVFQKRAMLEGQLRAHMSAWQDSGKSIRDTFFGGG